MSASSEQMKDKDLHYLEVRSLKKVFSMRDGTKLPVVDVPISISAKDNSLRFLGKAEAVKVLFLIFWQES